MKLPEKKNQASFSENNIRAFTKFLKAQPQSFFNDYSTELSGIIQDNKSNHKQLSIAILDWCESHSFNEALEKERSHFPTIPAARFEGDEPPDEMREYIMELENALRGPEPPNPKQQDSSQGK